MLLVHIYKIQTLLPFIIFSRVKVSIINKKMKMGNTELYRTMSSFSAIDYYEYKYVFGDPFIRRESKGFALFLL